MPPLPLPCSARPTRAVRYPARPRIAPAPPGRGVALALFLAAAAAATAHAQLVQGPWVQQSEQAIQKHRTVAARVLVLDARGNPAANASLSLELQRHAFAFGVVLDPAWFASTNFADADAAPAPPGIPVGSDPSDVPVWRCFSAASLRLFHDWPTTHPTAPNQGITPGTTPGTTPGFIPGTSPGTSPGVKPGASAPDPPTAPPTNSPTADAALRWALAHRLTPRYGHALAADRGRWPEWVAARPPDRLLPVLQARLDEVLRHPAGVLGIDLIADLHRRDDLTATLGIAGLRRLLDHARSADLALPTPRQRPVRLRFTDALVGDEHDQALRTLARFRDHLLPVDAVTLDAHVTTAVVQAPVQRALDALANLDLRITIDGLLVGGSSDAAAQTGMEVLLRSLFACPAVESIYFVVVPPMTRTGQGIAVHPASLFDPRGGPSALGQTVDHLIHRTWRSDVNRPTDALGNWRGRLFPGWYRASVILPDGTSFQQAVAVPHGTGEALLVLQPLPPSPAVPSDAGRPGSEPPGRDRSSDPAPPPPSTHRPDEERLAGVAGPSATAE